MQQTNLRLHGPIPHDAMHSADYAIARMGNMSVRVSVCHTPVLCQNGQT